MASQINFPEIGGLRRWEALAEPTPAQVGTLLEEFERIIVEDNRKGVLSGLDKDGIPLTPVKYRGGRATATRARKAQFGFPSGEFKGLGLETAHGIVPHGDPHAYGNLSAAEYKRQTGPPLAPRGAESRVITNLTTLSGPVGDGRYQAVGLWEEVLSRTGYPFLHAHFDGLGRLPRRDLRGLREWGRTQARYAVLQWADAMLQGRL